MKFTVPVSCSCGFGFRTAGYAELTFPPATCPRCSAKINIVEPLTISTVAERLLHRSDAELKSGDFTLPIILSAMAIEVGLIQLFLKWKAIEHNLIGPQATEMDYASWRKEFRAGAGKGGFKEAIDFVSKSITGKAFDNFVGDFLQRAGQKDLIKAGLTAKTQLNDLKKQTIYDQLYAKRNRVMHAGKVDHSKDDAEKAFSSALHAFSMLKLMNRQRADKLDAQLKARLRS